jgi:ABC-type multidrug transport system permease subunit
MEVTFVWSWFSFWMGVLATFGFGLVSLFIAALSMQAKKRRKW